MYLTLHNSTMVVLHSTRLYITLPWLKFTLLDCINLPWIFCNLLVLYITLPWLYFTPLDSTLLYNGSTSFYITLPWLYINLLDST